LQREQTTATARADPDFSENDKAKRLFLTGGRGVLVDYGLADEAKRDSSLEG
jgi:hypothetical protein